MSHTTVLQLIAFAAAMIAGAINTVAGGGTLLTFPVLLWIGLPSVIANATSTVGILAASFGGIVGFRREMEGLTGRSYMLIVPSVAGGILGAVLLRLTPTQLFDRLVPVLILFATFLFMLQDPVQRLIRRTGISHADSRGWLIGTLVFQFVVAMYGGYFGAGMGILMLAAMGILGYTDIHQMNGLKNLLALAINGVAAVYFIVMGMVQWPWALVMAAGAIAGGYGGTGVARRIGAKGVRRIVVIVGFSIALSLIFRR